MPPAGAPSSPARAPAPAVIASAPPGRSSAPNLSDIGAVRSAGSLQRSLLDPTSQMMPINRPVRVVTKDGTIINGRRLNEDTYSLQIIDDGEQSPLAPEGRPARIHDLHDVADAVVQEHALRRRGRRRARLSAFAERTVVMSGRRRLFALVRSCRADRPAVAARARQQVTSQRLAAAASEPQNWLTYSGGYYSQRYSPLDSDHAGQRQEPEAAVGLPVAGRRQLADDAARGGRRHVPHAAPERRRRARRR